MRQSGGVATRHFRNVPASAARVGASARAFPEAASRRPLRGARPRGRSSASRPASGSATAGQVVPAGVMRIGAQPSAVAFTGARRRRGDRGHGDRLPAPIKDGIRTVVAATCFTACTRRARTTRHGTHVAGIVAAASNDIDVVGVAPGARRSMRSRSWTAAAGQRRTVCAGLDWIADSATQVSPRDPRGQHEPRAPGNS